MVSRRSRRRRRFRLLLLTVLAGLVGLLLAARLAAPSLLQAMAVRALDRQGLGPARLELAWDGLFSLHASALQLGAAGALTAAGADVAFSPAGLAAGRIDQ